MSQRVTIAVPEPLFTRLQPVKHQFNISAVCQEALEMAITIEEIKTQVAEDENLVQRLQTEKKVLLNKVRQEGFELGIRSSAKLSYKDFRHFERVQSLATALDEDVLDYLFSYLDQKDCPEPARQLDADFAYLLEVDPASRITFAQGWIDGVLSVWQTIKTQVDTAQ
ncbi:hypothetical protein [Floridanema evergladense]|uniref:Uncharacterized protein n=1 Tax=Floridaenema evergladense BLCC-F167 TaxID=3153639 RepID=A0ABV4WN94_9CYAN